MEKSVLQVYLRVHSFFISVVRRNTRMVSETLKNKQKVYIFEKKCGTLYSVAEKIVVIFERRTRCPKNINL